MLEPVLSRFVVTPILLCVCATEALGRCFTDPRILFVFFLPTERIGTVLERKGLEEDNEFRGRACVDHISVESGADVNKHLKEMFQPALVVRRGFCLHHHYLMFFLMVSPASWSSWERSHIMWPCASKRQSRFLDEGCLRLFLSVSHLQQVTVS